MAETAGAYIPGPARVKHMTKALTQEAGAHAASGAHGHLDSYQWKWTVRLDPALSAYLNLMRFVAAAAVLFGHMDQDGLTMDWNPLAWFSHDAVVIFFVLSGFIIYYSTKVRASTWQQYFVARMSRIYSVALPCVVVCVGIAVILPLGTGFQPELYSNYSPPSLWHTVSSLLFLNESWLNPADLTFNHPYWSLCYEVWYYVLFGIYCFTAGHLRWISLGAAALIAGPAILALLPVWLMGAWMAAGAHHETQWRAVAAWAAFVFPLVLLVVIKLSGADLAIKVLLHESIPGFWRLGSSQRLVTDHAIGAALCLHIAAFSSLPRSVHEFFVRHEATLNGLAAFSFTLYLFHRPFTQFLGATWPQASSDALVTVFIALGVLAACWLVSWGTERQLGPWRTGISRVFLRRA